jgi:hypothetical protein
VRRPNPKVLAAVVGVELVVAVLAYRDLSRRPAELVRGPKKLWRVVIGMNPGNSLAYWLLGRRSQARS